MGEGLGPSASVGLLGSVALATVPLSVGDQTVEDRTMLQLNTSSLFPIVAQQRNLYYKTLSPIVGG